MKIVVIKMLHTCIDTNSKHRSRKGVVSGGTLGD